MSGHKPERDINQHYRDFRGWTEDEQSAHLSAEHNIRLFPVDVTDWSDRHESSHQRA